ncbi:MAG: ribosomal protein [Parcubacteria group bacterium]|nr:ribosomal protein [Parcubacteria group bacterium]
MKKKLDLKEKNPEELMKMLKEKREELRGVRFSAAGARAKDGSVFAKTRRDVARVLTELGNRAKKA